MKNKFFVYAVLVATFSTAASWTSLMGASSRTGGSSWSSHSGGGYSGGYSGGGHK
jgi:uncharacterized membrane protein